MKTSDALRRNLPAVGAAVRSIIIFIAVLSIPLTAAQALAPSPTETSSWILALYGLPGLLTLFLALRYRQPLLVIGDWDSGLFVAGERRIARPACGRGVSTVLFKTIHRGIELGHLILALVFILCAIALLGLALVRLWQGVNPVAYTVLEERVSEVLESIAILTVAIAVLELGQTIIEEEVQRDTPMSAPTRVRRFLSRFMMVLVVALSIETLVAVFKFAREDPSRLPGAAAVGLVAAVLLAAWGLFVRLNQRAEEMEPEALDQVRREDEKVAG